MIEQRANVVTAYQFDRLSKFTMVTKRAQILDEIMEDGIPGVATVESKGTTFEVDVNRRLQFGMWLIGRSLKKELMVAGLGDVAQKLEEKARE